jgi:hypothetical protein
VFHTMMAATRRFSPPPQVYVAHPTQGVCARYATPPAARPRARAGTDRGRHAQQLVPVRLDVTGVDRSASERLPRCGHCLTNQSGLAALLFAPIGDVGAGRRAQGCVRYRGKRADHPRQGIGGYGYSSSGPENPLRCSGSPRIGAARISRLNPWSRYEAVRGPLSITFRRVGVSDPVVSGIARDDYFITEQHRW